MLGNPVKQFTSFANFGLHGVIKGYKDSAKYAMIDAAQTVPIIGDWLAEQLGLWLFGNLDVPKKILDTIDVTLRSVGGYDKETQMPFLRVDRQKSYSNPAFWTVGIDYLDKVRIDNIRNLEKTMADKLCRKLNGKYTLRVVEYPVRIEVDRPEKPDVNLSDIWGDIDDYRDNTRTAFLGMTWDAQYAQYGTVQLDNMDSMVGIFGTTGSGKSQMATSILLSLAINNDPNKFQMIICDPKAFDFKYLHPLPHVVGEVLEDAQPIYDVVANLARELERRKQARRDGVQDLGPIICLYIDELEDLLDRVSDISANHKKTFIANLATLTRQGRSYDYIVILASQAATGYDTKLTRNLNVRVVGKVANGNASVDSTGVAGSQCHLLPGSGAFEVYQGGQLQGRIQGAYVGDSKKVKKYEKIIQEYADMILDKWGMPESVIDLEPAEIQMYDGLNLDLPESMIDQLIEMANDNNLSGNKIRKLYQDVTQKTINGYKAKEILDKVEAYLNG